MKYSNLVKSALVISLTATLAACGSSRISPDEFDVINRAPLIIPPENGLRPPRPGEPRAQEIDPGRMAFDAIFPGKTFRRQERLSAAELSVVTRVGSSDSGIRANPDKDGVDVVKKVLLLDDILNAEDRSFRPDNIEITRLYTESIDAPRAVSTPDVSVDQQDRD